MTDSDPPPDPSPDPLAIVHDLAAFPPLHDADLRARTRGCETEALVAALEEAVEDADDELEESRLLELLARLEPRHEWVAAAADSERAAAAAPPLRALPADVEATLSDQVGHLVEAPRDAAAIADTIARLPASLQVGLLQRLDRVRAQSGTPAPLLYGPLLGKPLAAEVRAVIDEALAKDAQRSRRVEGFAWLASCDGTGAVSCFLGLRNPDTTHTVVHAVLRVDGGIVDAAVMARQSKKAVERLLDEARVDGIDFARAPVELAARLVADAAERGHARGAAPPPDAEQALALLAPIALAPRPPRSAPLVIAMPPEPVESLFRRGEYVSWFLDAGERLDAGVAPPRGHSGADESAAEEWVEKALPKLDRPPLRERVSAMAAYMGLWHELRRESQLAALLRALAWPATTSFVGDAVAEHAEPEAPCGGAPANELFFGLVARSYFLAREQLEPPSVAGALGDPEVRQGIKERLFAKSVAPSGRDLARLDLVELFLALFDATLAVVAPARRPDGAGRDALALRLADAVVAAREKAATGARAPLVETLASALRGEGSKLTAGDAAALAEQLAPALVDEFLKETCAACPIDCWSKLDQDAAAPFFATHHPAAEALDEQAAAADEADDADDVRPADSNRV